MVSSSRTLVGIGLFFALLVIIIGAIVVIRIPLDNNQSVAKPWDVESETDVSSDISNSSLPEENIVTLRSFLQFNASNAWEHLVYQVNNISYRYPGSAGIIETREYINNTLVEFGWDTHFHHFTVQADETISNANILATRSENPSILLGAHFDTRLRADNDPNISRRNEPVLGANDGASGVAVLLEYARLFTALNIQDVALVFFDAEDQGNGGIAGWDYIEGSRAFVEENQTPPSIEKVVILDLIGDKDLTIYKEKRSTASLQDELFASASYLKEEGNIDTSGFIPTEKYSILDDHIPFLEAGYQAVDLIDFDYDAWHTTYDDLDHVSQDSLEQVGLTVEYWIRCVAS